MSVAITSLNGLSSPSLHVTPSRGGGGKGVPVEAAPCPSPHCPQLAQPWALLGHSRTSGWATSQAGPVRAPEALRNRLEPAGAGWRLPHRGCAGPSSTTAPAAALRHQQPKEVRETMSEAGVEFCGG